MYYNSFICEKTTVEKYNDELYTKLGITEWGRFDETSRDRRSSDQKYIMVGN